MKRILFLSAICLLFSVSAFSVSPLSYSGLGDGDQPSLVKDTVSTPDSTSSSITCDGANFNFVSFWKKKRKMDPHWEGLGISIANFDGTLGADLKTSKSYSIIFNPLEYYVPLNNNFMLVSGVGIDWSRYHFEGNTGLQEVNGITQFVPAPEGINYTSSKLLAYYFTLPLFLEYQKKITKKQDFFVSGGLVGYVKCYSKSQVEYMQEGNEFQVNKGRDLNILPVNARAMAQIGFGEVSVYGYYSLFSMFEKGKGPDVRPIGIGIVLDF